MFDDLQKFNDTCWKEILSLVNDSAVYIDSATAECLHWHTGDKAYLTLKDAGARSVHELALYNFCYVKANATKAVIVCTSTDSIFYQRTLQIIIEKNKFKECIIVCAAHKKILNYTSNIFPTRLLRDNSYETLKSDVLHWMNDRNLKMEMQVRILFKPIFIAEIKDNLFVTPTFGNLMPNVNKELTEDIEDDIEFLVSSFHCLFSHFDAIEDIYCLGKLSNYIGDKLHSFPAAVNRRKLVTPQRNISLILVDRLLDLPSATSYNTESMMGRILNTLPHLPHHYNDVAVQMHSLCSQGEECLSSLMVPGCLANNSEDLMSIIFNKKQKDVLMILNKMLIDMSSSQRGSPRTNKISTRISAHSLEKGIQKYKDKESMENMCKYSKNLQLIAAVVQSLKSNKTSQIEFAVSLEKLILQNLAAIRDSSNILSQLSTIIKTREKRGLEMENLLAILLYIYALAGSEIKFSKQQEESLMETLAGAIYEDIKKCNDTELTDELSAYYQTLLLLGATNENTAKEVSVKVTEKIMSILSKVSKQRESLNIYRNVLSDPNFREVTKYVGLIERLISDLLDESKREIPDLVCKTSSLLSTSFSLLTKGTINNHPCDNQWIIIYVIGGVTPDESKIVEDIISKKGTNKSPKITLGGSRLLSPLDIVDKILLSSINNI